MSAMNPIRLCPGLARTHTAAPAAPAWSSMKTKGYLLGAAPLTAVGEFAAAARRDRRWSARHPRTCANRVNTALLGFLRS